MATLYVNATGGDDSRTYAQAQNPATPWLTIGRAAWGDETRSTPDDTQSAQPGDTVIIVGSATYASPVTYSTNENVYNREIPVYNPAQQGSVGNYITFQASGYVKLAAPAANSPVAGSYGQDYIKWYADRADSRFIIVCDGTDAGAAGGGAPSNDTKSAGFVNPTPDTGPVAIVGADHCWIEGFDIDGGVTVDYTDNYPGIRLSGATNATVRNNSITSFRNATDSVNGTGIQVYDSRGCLVENNTITDCGSGIIQKNAPTVTTTMGEHTIRYNWIEDCWTMLEASFTTTGGSTILRSDIYQNVGVNMRHFYRAPGNRGAVLDHVYNNTAYDIQDLANLAVGIEVTYGEGGKIWNNILDTIPNASFHMAIAGPMPTAAEVSYEHNVYGHVAGTFYNDGTLGNRTFNQYLGDWSDQDGAAPAAVDGDPLFVDAANGDFRLQSSSSSAWNQGRGVDSGLTVHAGAYITGSETIGVTSAAAAATTGGGHLVLLIGIL